MSDLRDWLENAEVRYRKVFGTKLPGGNANGNMQVFAYQKGQQPTGIPVVCVGSNYGRSGESGCAANLRQWMDGYIHMRDIFVNTPSWKLEWEKRGWSSKPFPHLPARDETFFIMTNLCPWLTDIDWGNKGKNGFSAVESRRLLQVSQLLGQYLHVEELIGCLLQQGREFVVVGHGINDNILPEIKYFLEGRERWMRYANLTFEFRPVLDGKGNIKFRL